MADIFLDHTAEDAEQATSLADEFEKQTWSVFRPPTTDPLDPSTREQLDRELAEARAVVVLWSHAAALDPAVCRSAERALERVPMIPVLLDDAPLPEGLRATRSVNLSGWVPGQPSKAMVQLLDALRRDLKSASSSPARPAIRILTDAVPAGIRTAVRNAAWQLRSKLPRFRLKHPVPIPATESPTPNAGGAVSPAAPDTEDDEVEAGVVLLGASAPAAVRPEDEFTARFVAHTEQRKDEIKAMLEALSPGTVPHLALKKTRWMPGTKVTVRLSARRLEIEDGEQHFAWSGDYDILEWAIYVPEATDDCSTVLKYDVFVEGVQVARLRIDLQVTANPRSVSATVKSTEPAASAFASFSSEDELRVSDRVDSLRTATGMDIFYSRDSIHAGGRWKEVLEKEIQERDLFLLFWSEHAAGSKWVDWEWRTAFPLKGEDRFQLHCLQPKEIAPPPPELAALQFESPLMIIRRWDEIKNQQRR